VGFGISTAAQVREVAASADGVVVGSALVNVVKDNLNNRAGLAGHLRTRAAELAGGVR
jgi:tryptophan synthase alpha chain